jgi:hypothetical protein
MGAGMAEILALKVDPPPTQIASEATGKVERGLPAGILAEIMAKLPAKGDIATDLTVGLL